MPADAPNQSPQSSEDTGSKKKKPAQPAEDLVAKKKKPVVDKDSAKHIAKAKEQLGYTQTAEF